VINAKEAKQKAREYNVEKDEDFIKYYIALEAKVDKFISAAADKGLHSVSVPVDNIIDTYYKEYAQKKLLLTLKEYGFGVKFNDTYIAFKSIEIEW
jgi:hypothetical protein